MPIGTCSLRGMGMKRSTLGSMSHETEDRFGALAEALYSTTLGHVAFVQGSIFDSVGVFRCMLKRILLPKMWQKVCGPSSLENEPTIFGATEFCSYFVALSYSRALLSDGRRVRPSVCYTLVLTQTNNRRITWFSPSGSRKKTNYFSDFLD